MTRAGPTPPCRKGALRRAAERVLLPSGFPHSVSPDYLQYQCWDSAQALCSSLSGIIATRAVFEAVGVGDGAATPMGATLTWLLRDGVGMVTRIAFASIQGSALDCEAKQWRLAADVINDAALLLELSAPAWPGAAPLVLAGAAAARSVVGVAGGATRAAIAVHQARRDNAAEVAAKDGSQETVVNALGLLLALLLLPVLEGRPWLTWLLVLLLTAAHLGANMAAVRSLCIPTLNRPRLRLALSGALRGLSGALRGPTDPKTPTPNKGGVTVAVPTPREVNPKEPLLPGFSSRLRLRLGAPKQSLVGSEAEFRKAVECGSPDYIIVLRPSQGWVGVGLRDGAPPDAPLRGCAHALLLEELLGADLPPMAPMGAALRPLQQRLRRCPPGSVPWATLAEISRLWDTLGPAFLRGLEDAGWSTRRHQLAADEWRLQWAGPRPESHAHPSLTTPT